jgi:DNA-binding NarL/FixJ family response regulator
MKTIRILLVDDQALFREGLRVLLSTQSDIEIIGEVGNGQEALAFVKLAKPHVVLMDLRMPIMGGVEATLRIRAAEPNCSVIVLTTFDDDSEVFDALRAGAAGYLLKDAPLNQLTDAIRAAAQGESFLQPSIATKVVAEFNRLPHATSNIKDDLLEPLSHREREVLGQLARGKSNKEIADALYLAEGTVKNHMSNILAKLGVMDRTQAALKARAMGLI